MGDTVKTRLCIAVTALAVAVLAGGWLLGDAPKPDEPPKVKGQLPAHFKKLGLSDKQVQQIYKIESGYREKIQALQAQIDDLKKAEHLEVDDVLTDDQKTAPQGASHRGGLRQGQAAASPRQADAARGQGQAGPHGQGQDHGAARRPGQAGRDRQGQDAAGGQGQAGAAQGPVTRRSH